MTGNYRVDCRFEGRKSVGGVALSPAECGYMLQLVNDAAERDADLFQRAFGADDQVLFERWRTVGMEGSELSRAASVLREGAFQTEHLGETPVAHRLGQPREFQPGVFDTLAAMLDHLALSAGVSGRLHLASEGDR